MDEVVVTGSLVVRDGYQAPSPVTVATADALTRAAPTSITKGLVQLPLFGSSNTTETGNRQSQTVPNQGNNLNIRSIGAIRTLILVDGFRATPTTFTGLVDVDSIPQLLVQRVDVVTAGASATYGSDAVAGVVNFVLDRKLDGFRGRIQGGGSKYGDAWNSRVGLAYGARISDKAHIVLAGEHYENSGYSKTDRPAFGIHPVMVGSVIGSSAAPGTIANPAVDNLNVRQNSGTDGGIFINGPFNQTVFLAPGVYRTAITGGRTGSSLYFTPPSDYYAYPPGAHQGSPIAATNVFAGLRYDIAPDIAAYLQVNGARNNMITRIFYLPQFSQAIFADNAFLPEPLRQQMVAANLSQVSFSRWFPEFGRAKRSENFDHYSVRAGVDGKTGQFNWRLGYQHGESVSIARAEAIDRVKLAAATDAVRAPNGSIVCRSTLDANPVVRARYADCVPFNQFGAFAGSPAAMSYVLGERISKYRALNQSDNAIASISGDLFDLWAGPVSAAIGAEYRAQKLKLTSNSDPALAQDITGVRGLTTTVTKFNTGNFGTARGKNDVKEVFGEIALPLLKDQPLAESLAASGAVRLTDYSTSGTVTTWKVGATWQPVEDLNFRMTRSRDIRAPTLFELFQGDTLSPIVFTDPHTGRTASLFQRTGGNPNLKPEIGDTFTLGFVARPRWLPGLTFSVDYYNLKIDGAIQTISVQTAALECEASNGTSPSCAALVRPGPFSDRSATNFPTELRSFSINIASLKTRGVDVEATYRANDVWGGALTARLSGNFVDSYRTQASAGQPVIEYAGYAEGAQGLGLPDLKINASVQYQRDVFGLFLQERYIGRIKRGPIIVWNEPSLPEVFYTDVTLTYDINAFGGKSQAFFTVNNLFNRQPPTYTYSGSQFPALTAVHDTLGRNFSTGVRFEF